MWVKVEARNPMEVIPRETEQHVCGKSDSSFRKGQGGGGERDGDAFGQWQLGPNPCLSLGPLWLGDPMSHLAGDSPGLCYRVK